MLGKIILAGLVITAISGAFGWTYFEGRRAGIAHNKAEVQKAVDKEVARLEKVVQESEAKAQEYAQQIALYAKEKNDLLDQLSEEAELDPSTTALSSSRMYRLNALRDQQSQVQ